MRRGFVAVLVAGILMTTAFAAVSASVLAKPGQDLIAVSEPAPSAAPKEWTFMVYLDADNNLEPYAFMDLEEMQDVGSTDKVNIVVLMDMWTTFPDCTHWFYISGTKETHVDVEVGVIECDCIMFVEEDDCCKELNMADGKNLTNFIVKSVTKFPADNYVLVLWDHGGGWRGVCWDDHSFLSDGRVDRLTTPETATAIEDAIGILAEDAINFKVSILAYDACLNGVVDVVYENRFAADYMVASMTLVPAYGMDYYAFLLALTADPSMTVEAAGTKMVDTFVDSYSFCAGGGIGSSLGDVGMALIDLSKANALGTAMYYLSKELYDNYVDDYRFRGAIESSESQTPMLQRTGEQIAYTDLGLFASLLAEKIPEIYTLATAVATAVDYAVVYCRYVQTESGAVIRTTGISVYFTCCYDKLWLDYAYDTPEETPETEVAYFGWDFTRYTYWDEVLMEFTMAITPGEPTEPIE